MSLALAVDLTLGILPFIVGYATYRLSARSQAAHETAAGKAVDAAAYERARGIYEGAIAQLVREGEAARQERDRLAGEVRRLSSINDRLEAEAGKLEGVRGEVRRLTEANRRLRAQIEGAQP